MKLVGRVNIADCEALYTPISNKPCVYYLLTVSEENEKTREVSHTHTDSEGNTTTTV